MTHYRLQFEYLNPFKIGGDRDWIEAQNISEDLALLKSQMEAQLLMPDVRNSRISKQEVGPWEPL
jgi:hypothetical protein